MMNKERFIHYTIGIPELDTEHWELFMVLNEFREAIKNTDKVLARTLLEKFFTDLTTHCLHEEEIMDKVKFPYATAHKQNHPESSMQLLKFRAKDDCDLCAISVSEMELLLSTHIDYADRQIAPFYQSWLKNQPK